MIATITNHIAHGLQSVDTPANKMTFYKTNFNMPVPDVFDSAYNPATMRYVGNATFLTETTSYNLSGFSPGYEVCVGESVWDYENNTGGNYTISSTVYQRWTDPAVTTTLVEGLWGYFVGTTLPAFTYTTFWAAYNIGIASWEISSDATYHFRANALGTDSIAVVDTGVAITNCPSTTKLSDGTQGYIWVEGNNLCYVNNGGGSTGGAGGWKHTMVGTDISSTPGVPKAGSIWVDQYTYGIHWVGGNGHDYQASWRVKQFASIFSNSSTGTAGGGTAGPGYIWVDSEFGNTHLGYIASDGYKYLTGAGVDPYL